MQAVSLSFFRFDGVGERLWAFSQMQFARPGLARLPGIGFHKLFGTGTGEGFTPVPNFGVYAVMATWPDLETARKRVATGEVYRRYRAHADESCTIFMSAVSSRGQWDAREPFETEGVRELPRPIAVITRATLKKKHVLDFWGNTPGISVTVREQDHLLFKMGMGEVPWFQQVTFSIWDDPEAMKAFAYGSASHAAAIKGVRQNGWFKEELYARFRVLGSEGTWQSREPLAA
jgi:spheroidene monooxygenase